MTIAEQKVALLKMIIDADESTTMKLADFANSLNIQTAEFSSDDIAEFEKRSITFQNNPESGIPWKEAMSNIRERLSK